MLVDDGFFELEGYSKCQIAVFYPMKVIHSDQTSLGDLMHLFLAFDIDRPLQSVYCLLQYLCHIYN
jgi:hypothetical protein